MSLSSSFSWASSCSFLSTLRLLFCASSYSQVLSWFYFIVFCIESCIISVCSATLSLWLWISRSKSCNYMHFFIRPESSYDLAVHSFSSLYFTAEYKPLRLAYLLLSHWSSGEKQYFEVIFWVMCSIIIYSPSPTQIDPSLFSSSSSIDYSGSSRFCNSVMIVFDFMSGIEGCWCYCLQFLSEVDCWLKLLRFRTENSESSSEYSSISLLFFTFYSPSAVKLTTNFSRSIIPVSKALSLFSLSFLSISYFLSFIFALLW